MKYVAALLLSVLAGHAWAQPAGETSPVAATQAALVALERASQRLDDAETARDRVRALTATIRALEDGLAAMREGARRVAVRERALTEKLDAQEAEIATLLGALQTLGRQDSPALLLHPSGAVGTARASMLLAELGPALNDAAREVRADLEDVQTLRVLQQAAADRTAQGLTKLQTARSALNAAMAERTDLPQRFVEDPTRAAILIATAETLAGFASGLNDVVATETAPALERASPDRLGQYSLPVRGTLLRRAGETDAAGVSRPGILLASRPEALVTAPMAATIRYAGPLLEFGNVVILEPEAGTLLILAGLGTVFGTAGHVITEATPVGLMPQRGENGSTGGERGGTGRTETLYIEVRQNNLPVNPAIWFDFEPGQ